MTERERAIALIQGAAERGLLLDRGSDSRVLIMGQGAHEFTPKIELYCADVAELLKEKELSKEVNPLGLYERLEQAPETRSNACFKRMKELRDRGIPYFQAMRVARIQNIAARPSGKISGYPPETRQRNAAAAGRLSMSSRTAPRVSSYYEPLRLPVSSSPTSSVPIIGPRQNHHRRI